MPYCTPNDVRLRAVGMTEEVIPDVSSAGANLTTCIEETGVEVDEAARAGDYEAPFDPVPERIQDLCAVGALAKARRALELGNQPAAAPDPYRAEFEGGLELLRKGEMDLGKVSVTDETVVLPSEAEEWVSLAHRALAVGSVTATNEAATVTYVEDREAYEPGYRSGSAKDYRVDHRLGRIAWLESGRMQPGQTVKVSYEYFRWQPGRGEEAEYGRRTASAGELLRGDRQRP